MFNLPSEEITEGPIFRALAILSVPLVLQNVVQAGQLLVDLFWLGRLGGGAVSAVAIDSALVQLLIGFAVFAPFVGSQVLVSQRIGSEDETGAIQAAWTGLTVAVVFSAIIGFFAHTYAQNGLTLILSVRPESQSESIVQLAVVYLKVIALGLPLLAVTDTVEASYIGWGASGISMWMNLIAVGTNFLLDPILIFGLGPSPAFGIQGAAAATVLGSAVSLIAAIGGALTEHGPKFLFQPKIITSSSEYRELLNIGIPSAAQNVFRQLANIILVVVVFAAGGAAGLAAYLIGNRVARVAYVPAFGIRQAAQSIVGQNLGAEKVSRVSRVVWGGVAATAILLGIIGGCQLLIPKEIVAVLAPEADVQTTELSIRYLRILALGYPAFGAFYLLRAGFDGARKTRTTFVAVFSQYWLLRIPIAVIGGISLHYGVAAVFYANPLSTTIIAITLGWYYWHSSNSGMLITAAKQASN